MLTFKQKKLLLFVDTFISTNGISPSFMEMQRAMDLKSKSGIHRMLDCLVDRGFIRRLANRARAIEVIKLPGKPVNGFDFAGIKIIEDDRVPEGEVWVNNRNGILQKFAVAS